MKDYSHITRKCFISSRWYELKEKYIDLFVENNIQPEIGLEGTCLYDENIDEFKKIAAILKKNNLDCTIHAPFFDLSLGALDPKILQISREKLDIAFNLLEIFEPKSIVCHLQYEDTKQGYKFDNWFKNASESWSKLVAKASRHKLPIMLENTYETNPETHKKLLRFLDSNYALFCLDVGHLMSFSKTRWQDWLPTLTPWLGQLHLHDNLGDKDSHLAPGLGNFNFQELFEYLSKNNLQPIITLEPHSEKDMYQSLEYFDKTQLLKLIT